MEPSFETDIGWISAFQALKWAAQRTDTQDKAKAKLADHLRDGDVRLRYKVWATGQYLGGKISRFVPIVSERRRGTSYADRIIVSSGFGELAPASLWRRSENWERDTSLWNWDRGVLAVVKQETANTWGSYVALYDCQFELIGLQSVGLATVPKPPVSAGRRGPSVQQALGWWMGELFLHLRENGIPSPPNTDDVVDTVNERIRERANDPEAPHEYREMKDRTAWPYADKVLKLAEAREAKRRWFPETP